MYSSIISATSISLILLITHCSGGGNLVIVVSLVGVDEGVCVRDRASSDQGRVVVDVARRRYVLHHHADDLVQHGHLWQPWFIRKRCLDIGPRVAPTDSLQSARSSGV